MWASMSALPPDAENDEICLCTCFRLWVRSEGYQETGTTEISLFPCVCVCSSSGYSETEVLETSGSRESRPPSPLPAMLMDKLHLWSSSGQPELPRQTLWRALARDSCCSALPGSSSFFFVQTSQRFCELLTQQPFIFFEFFFLFHPNTCSDSRWGWKSSPWRKKQAEDLTICR